MKSKSVQTQPPMMHPAGPVWIATAAERDDLPPLDDRFKRFAEMNDSRPSKLRA